MLYQYQKINLSFFYLFICFSIQFVFREFIE